MLTESGYLGGLVIYVGAALLALLLMNLWLLAGRSAALRVLLSAPLAAVLLTPAYIQPDADTFAPALIVAAFQWFSQGPEAADHALRPLGLFSGLAFAVGLVAALLLLWRQRAASRSADSGE